MFGYNKYNDELIGFVDSGDPELNYSTFTDSDQFVIHALVYYGSGSTHCATFNQPMPVFWKAVSVLDLTCKLHVIATVSDGVILIQEVSSNASFTIWQCW